MAFRLDFRGMTAGAALTLGTLAAPLAWPGSLHAQTLNPYGRTIDLVVPLREGERLVGTLPLRLGADDSLSVEAEPYAGLLGSLLTEEARAKLLAAADAEGRVTPEASAAVGLPLEYDPGAIELRLTVPADRRPTTELALRTFGTPPIGALEEPANLSGYLNVLGSIDYITEGGDEGLSSPLLALDGAVRALGVVLEAEAAIDTDAGDDDTFQRREVRLVKDWPGTALRAAVGDFRAPGTSFQASPRVLGVGVVRSYRDLQPYRTLTPQGLRSFTLERASNVDVLINGLLVERLRLQPGGYDLRNFPFARGANDVRLIIEDDLGVIEEIVFTNFFDGALLSPGVDEFGLSAGITSQLENGSIVYDDGEPVVSGFYRRGITETVTLGGNAQGDGDVQIVGADALTVTPAGVFEAEAALSFGDGTGYALNVDWEYPFANRGLLSLNRFLGVSAEHRSEEFSGLGGLGFGSTSEVDLALRYGQDLPFGVRGALGLSYELGRDDSPDRYGASLGLSRAFTSRLALSTSFGYDDDGTGEEDLRAFVGVSYALGRRQRLSASYDTADSRVRADYSLVDTGRLGGYGLGIGVERDDESSSVDGRLAVTGNRYGATLAHDTRFEGLGSEMTSQTTRAAAATSVVFADGAVGLSRPIGDSFAILVPHENLENRTVYVDPSRDGDAGSSGVLGPAVHGGLRSYYNQRVTYDVDDLPTGYDLGKGNFEMRPPYKSGYLLTVGSDATVTAVGKLLNAKGEPLPLAVGQAVYLDEEGAEPQQVFSNRSGRFGLQGLKPGRYELVFEGEAVGRGRFEVPKGLIGLFRAGDVEISE